jgi:hypothetical protein
MALPASGILKLSDIIAEFGGPGNLRAYLYGGTYVTVADYAPNVPSSGNITLRNFLDAAKAGNRLSVVANPNYIDGFGVGISAQNVNTGGTTISSDGTGPFTYAWSVLSGGGTIIGTGAGVYVRERLPLWGMDSGQIQCVVTDSTGRTGSAIIDYYLDNS